MSRRSEYELAAVVGGADAGGDGVRDAIALGLKKKSPQRRSQPGLGVLGHIILLRKCR